MEDFNPLLALCALALLPLAIPACVFAGFRILAALGRLLMLGAGQA